MDGDEIDSQHLKESKFIHLLRPIRELADNWSVNIANELEEYIAHLDRWFKSQLSLTDTPFDFSLLHNSPTGLASALMAAPH